jgi:hypothetical protein
MLRKIKTKQIRKGQGFVEMFFVMVVLIALAFFFIFLNKMSSSIKEPLTEGLNSAMPTDSSVNITQVMNQTDDSTTSFNKLFPFILIGLFGFIFITGGFITQHPIMIIVGIILLGVGILLAVVYANVYNQIANSDEMASTTAKFPIQNLFMKYLPYIAFLTVLIITIALLLRRGGGGSGGL